MGRLIDACDHLENMMGWCDGRIKLRESEVAPWDAARKVARTVHRAG